MVLADLTLVAGLWILFALAAVALAAVILRARVYKRENLALVALLIQQALATGLSVVLFTGDDPATLRATFRFLVPVWLLWGPAVFLCGPMLLGETADRLAWGLGIAGALPGVALAGVGLLHPPAVLGAGSLEMSSLAAPAFFLVFLGFAVTVSLLAAEAIGTDLPTRRTQMGLLAAAFSVEGGYHAASNVAKLGLDAPYHGIEAAGALLSGVSLTPAIVFAGLAAWLAFRAASTDDAHRRKWALWVLGSLLASAATGVAASGIEVGAQLQEPVGAFHALWDLLAIVLIVFAGMRYQLFEIEQHAKRSITVSTVLGAGLLVFLSLQEILENVLSGTELVGQLPAAEVLAGVLVGLAFVPLRRLGGWVGARAFPEVTDSRRYEQERSAEVYRAALEGVFADGIKDAEEAASLRALREQLDISIETHRDMVDEVRELVEEGSTPQVAEG